MTVPGGNRTDPFFEPFHLLQLIQHQIETDMSDSRTFQLIETDMTDSWTYQLGTDDTDTDDRLRVGLLNRLSGRGTARAEDAQGTPTQSHISPSIPVHEDKTDNLQVTMTLGATFPPVTADTISD